jgi:hypothetical protein
VIEVFRVPKWHAQEGGREGGREEKREEEHIPS